MRVMAQKICELSREYTSKITKSLFFCCFFMESVATVSPISQSIRLQWCTYFGPATYTA